MISYPLGRRVCACNVQWRTGVGHLNAMTATTSLVARIAFMADIFPSRMGILLFATCELLTFNLINDSLCFSFPLSPSL